MTPFRAFCLALLLAAAAKQAEMQRRRTTFERAMTNMKILAEGGTLPPRAAPAAPAPAAPR